MNNAKNIKRINEFYEALGTDPERVINTLIADEFVWENPLPENIPFGGVYHGADGLRDYVQKIQAALEMTPLHFTDVVGEGDIVAAVGVEEGTLVKATGKRYTMPFVHVVRYNDEGKVVHVREYNDTLDMVAAYKA